VEPGGKPAARLLPHRATRKVGQYMRAAPPIPTHETRAPARRAPRAKALGALTVLATAGVVVACGETVVQIDPDDVVELLLSADSARIGLGRTFDLDALTLDEDNGLLVGQTVTWTSANAAVVSVDENGILTGESLGTANVVASFGSLSDTTFVTVVAPPVLVLSADSIGFSKEAGAAEPAPDTVDVTNGGVLDLVVSVDSIVYGLGAADWLNAQLASAVGPTTLAVSTTTAGLTAAGTYTATLWLSGFQADDSPAGVEVTLTVLAAAPFSMTVNDGDGQTRTAGSAVTVAPSVLVEDEFGNAAVGASVTFAVTAGGGQVTGSPAAANASGVARVGSWTLGNTAGDNELTATLGSLAPVVFSATGSVGAPTQVVVTAGNNQSAVAGAAVGTAPAVSVQDQHGNGVSGVAVTFAVTAGGGSITGGSQTSGALGIATLGSWTLGASAGTNTLSASAAGVGTPAVITATGLSGAADSIYLVAGDTQVDTVAATLPTAYSVRVVDTNGNGVEGIPIAWTATFGGGSITPLDTTDAQGYATAVRMLGTVPGPDSATAVVGGLAGSPVRFAATANVGTPNQIRVAAGGVQSDTVGEPVAIDPQVIVEDLFDNPIQGHSVTFQVTGGGGSVDPTTAVTTLADGTATATSWTLGTAAGTSNNTLRATAAGPGIAGQFVDFTATGLADAPTQFLIVAGDANTTTLIGQAVATAPRVVLMDQHDNAVPGQSVTFTASSGGSATSPVVTDANGEAATTWTVGATGAVLTNGTFTNTLTASATGFTPLQFTVPANYSYVTHVDQMWTPTCNGCHAPPTGTSGLVLDPANAAANYSALLRDQRPNCDLDSSLAATYRRISSAGGGSGITLSVLWTLMQASGSDAIDECGPHGFAKVSAANLVILEAWIRNGAPNN
jgi:adhesin/invasin